jgi:hypothetical protein
MSKGSGRRPSNLTETEWTNRWDAIFGRDLDKKEAIEDAMDELETETLNGTERVRKGNGLA